MTKDTVSIARLTAWLARFEALLGPPGAEPSLARGMTAVLGKVGNADAASIGELFTAVGMTLVGSASGSTGPLYGTFFLRFGMQAGTLTALDATSLGRALRAGHEGAVERGTAAIGDTTMLDTLARGVDAYDDEIARGSDAARAASTAFAAAQLPDDIPDPSAASVVLLFAALATALASD